MGLKTDRSIVLQEKGEGGMRYMLQEIQEKVEQNHSHTWLCFQQLQQWNSVSWLPHGSFLAHQHPGHTPNTPPKRLSTGDYFSIAVIK